MPLDLSQSRSPRPDPVHGIERLRTGINPPGRRFDPVHIGGRWQKSDLVYVSFFCPTTGLTRAGPMHSDMQTQRATGVECSPMVSSGSWARNTVHGTILLKKLCSSPIHQSLQAAL